MPNIINHPTSRAIIEKIGKYIPEFHSYFVFDNGVAITDRYRIFYTGDITGKDYKLAPFLSEYSDCHKLNAENKINIGQVIPEEFDFEVNFDLTKDERRILLAFTLALQRMHSKGVDVVFNFRNKKLTIKTLKTEKDFTINLRINFEIVFTKIENTTYKFNLDYLKDFLYEFDDFKWKGGQKSHLIESSKYNYLVGQLRE